MTTPQSGTGSALDELRAAYHDQLTRLAAERDEARRNARRAQAQADVARADLASLKSRVAELLTAASRHLPDLPAPDVPDVQAVGPATAPDVPASEADEADEASAARDDAPVEGRVVPAPGVQAEDAEPREDQAPEVRPHASSAAEPSRSRKVRSKRRPIGTG